LGNCFAGDCNIFTETEQVFITRLKSSMARIKVDLHPIYNNSAAIDRALQQAFNDAVDKKIREVEIIPGKGSGQLRKKVERFLQQPHIKPMYHRIENDSKNFGRLFVYFKF
jgi:dsDNA-specific endonuclease/ATPase MutS2